jgi:effector-binding domain-containing protein
VDQTEQKTAILKRLREMLVRQREKFSSYLRLLEQEEASINEGDSEKLLAQVEMEQSIIAEIFTLKKVIAPLETLYHAAYPDTEDAIPRLKTTLEAMGTEIIAHNARNRQLLSRRMEELRKEITSLRSWPHARSPFSEAVPSLIDITT